MDALVGPSTFMDALHIDICGSAQDDDGAGNRVGVRLDSISRMCSLEGAAAAGCFLPTTTCCRHHRDSAMATCRKVRLSEHPRACLSRPRRHGPKKPRHGVGGDEFSTR